MSLGGMTNELPLFGWKLIGMTHSLVNCDFVVPNTKSSKIKAGEKNRSISGDTQTSDLPGQPY